ncbi:hypothetical protein BJ742DRAFT_510639 [Cladochytrium replicatum]|nr:hypothetical protein BJ742DRAFT_510639 [Cladochytrium replicatum]
MRPGQYGMGRNIGLPGHQASSSFPGTSTAQVPLNSYGWMGMMGMRGAVGMGRERMMMDSFGGGMDMSGAMAGYGNSALEMEFAIAARARALAANEMMLRRQTAMQNAMGGAGIGGGLVYALGGGGVPRREMMDGGGVGLNHYSGISNRSFGSGMGSSRFSGGYGDVGMQNEVPTGIMGGMDDMYMMKQALMMEAVGATVDEAQFGRVNGTMGADTDMWNIGSAFRRAISDPELDRPMPRMYAGDLTNPGTPQITMRDLGVTGPSTMVNTTTSGLIPSVLAESEASPIVSHDLRTRPNMRTIPESSGQNMSLDPAQSIQNYGFALANEQSGSPATQPIATIGSDYGNTTSGQTRRWPVSTYSLSRNTKKMLANAGASGYLGNTYQQRVNEIQIAQMPYQNNEMGEYQRPTYPSQQQVQQTQVRPQPPALQHALKQNGAVTGEGTSLKRASAALDERSNEPNKRPRMENATSPPTRKDNSAVISTVRGSPATRFLEEAIGMSSRSAATQAEGDAQTKVQKRPNLMIQTRVERPSSRAGPPSTPVSQHLSSAVTACETPFSATPPYVPASLQHRLGPRAKFARPTALDLCASGPSPGAQGQGSTRFVFDSAKGGSGSCGPTRSPAEEVLMSPVAIVEGSGAEAIEKEKVACCPASGVPAGEWPPAHEVDCGGRKERVLFSACHVSLSFERVCRNTSISDSDSFCSKRVSEC